MDIFNPQLSFAPDKPFYPLVMAYLCQVHGFLDLASRGIYRRVESDLEKLGSSGLSRDELTQRLLGTVAENNRNFVEALLSGGKPVTPPLKPGLHSRAANVIKVDIEALATLLFEEHEPAIRYYNRISAGGLLIVAWANTEVDHTHDPLWEFLRHCRNAAAHKGFFNFSRGEPKRPANWRNLQIVSEFQGDPLFPDPPKKGFLDVGDILYLLADIERQFY